MYKILEISRLRNFPRRRDLLSSGTCVLHSQILPSPFLLPLHSRLPNSKFHHPPFPTLFSISFVNLSRRFSSPFSRITHSSFRFEKFHRSSSHRFINSNEFLSFPAHTSREVRFSILLTERLKNPPGRGGGGGGSRYLLFPSVRCQMVSERLKKKKMLFEINVFVGPAGISRVNV